MTCASNGLPEREWGTGAEVHARVGDLPTTQLMVDVDLDELEAMEGNDEQSAPAQGTSARRSKRAKGA